MAKEREKTNESGYPGCRGCSPTNSHLIQIAEMVLVPDAVGLYGTRLPHVHCLPGSGQHRVRPAVRCQGFLQGSASNSFFIGRDITVVSLTNLYWILMDLWIFYRCIPISSLLQFIAITWPILWINTNKMQINFSCSGCSSMRTSSVSSCSEWARDWASSLARTWPRYGSIFVIMIIYLLASRKKNYCIFKLIAAVNDCDFFKYSFFQDINNIWLSNWFR